MNLYQNAKNPITEPAQRPAPTGARRPRLVVIGGGTGSSVVLRGLRGHEVDVTAIVTMFDSGGSSGRLRSEFGYPPFGDLRQCMLALSAEAGPGETLCSALEYRFSPDSSLGGHNLGNLFLAALTSISSLEGAVDDLSRILQICGRVLPVSLSLAELCAELQDGTLVRGETAIDLRGRREPGILSVFLEPQVDANPRAIQAILEADAVILGPGDLYTSIIPNLLVRGISEALRRTQATRIYVCNLMTKTGETDNFAASHFVQEINHYLKGAMIDWALVNTAPIAPEIQRRYALEGATPVLADLERLAGLGVKSLGIRCAGNQAPVRHNPAALIGSILGLVHEHRLAMGRGSLLTAHGQLAGMS